jgi:hypothetical protein
MGRAPVPSGAWSALVLAAGVAAQWLIHDRSVVPVDEGQLAAIADRLARGEVLYRDVYTGIFPGVYHAAAALLAVFGDDLLVLRRAQLAVNAATAWLLWLVARRVARPGFAALAPALYLELVVFDFPGLSMLNYSPLAMLCALAALLALLRLQRRRRTRDAVAVGLCLGLCGLVKQNFGALAGLAVLAGLLADLRAPAADGARGAPAARALAGRIAAVGLGGAAVVAPALGAFAAAGALGALVDATLLTIGASQLEAFHDPLPPLLAPHPEDARFVFLYTPAALFNYLVRGESLLGLAISPAVRGASIRLAYGGALATLAAGALLALFAGRREAPAERAALRSVTAFGVLLSLGIFPSAIWSHLAFVGAPVLLVLAAVAERADRALAAAAPAAARAWRAGLAALAAGGAVASAAISLDVARWYPEPLGVARATLRVSPAQREQLRAATRFLEACARPDEPVFAAPDVPIVYFLAARANATRYDLVIPGNVSGRAIVADLERRGVRCAVYNPRMYAQFRPFAELFPEVAAHLAARFRHAADLGGGDAAWQGLVRADAAP